MDNFERFVRTAVADKALCESIVAGYHAYLEATAPSEYADAVKDAKEDQAVKKQYGFDPNKLDNRESSHFQDGWAAAQAKYGKQFRDKKVREEQDAAVAKAMAAKKGNAEVAGRTAGGDRGASRVSSTGAGTTPHDPNCGVKGQQAPKSVAAAMPSKKRTPKSRPAGNANPAAAVAAGNKPAQNAAPAAVAASQSADRRPEGNVEAANKQVAAKAREFYGKANELWREKYGEEPPADQKRRNQQAALKMAGQWYKNFMAANHQDTGLRVAGTNGDGKAKLGKRRGSERFQALMKQGDEAMENVKKGLSKFTSDDNS